MNGNHFSILTLARAGASSRAWKSFVASGLSDITDNPATLTLKGRLLKDQARKAQGSKAARLFVQSAKAYADAAALKPDSYPLINAATMSLFAGQSGHMAMLAKEVLSLLHTGVGGGETPYWHDATKAEAHLLLGRESEARAALSDAIAHAPNAWEDRATTLRQFRQILRYRGESDSWLEKYAPPNSLYFKGLIGLAPDDLAAADAIAELVDESGAAFGYGALAAGSDIMIAEALVQGGGELHLVLPTIASVFRAQSVRPYGVEWVARFDALFENAASVSVVGGSDILSAAAIEIAVQVAKGRAIDHAARLESKAVGIEIVDIEPRTRVAENDKMLVVQRSANFSFETVLPDHNVMVLMVTDAVPYAGIGDRADGLNVSQYGDLIQAFTAATQIRRDDPEARIAITLTVNNGEVANKQRYDSCVTRMMQATAIGTTIASSVAAMALKSEYPELWTEALGELPDSSGAIELYAIGQNY